MTWKISLFQLILTFALIFSIKADDPPPPSEENVTSVPPPPSEENATSVPYKDVDYCSKHLCTKGKHIACGNKGEINSKCAKNSEIIELTPEIKENIVRKHNEYRNQIAQGRVPNFQPATRMGTMQWHEELAKMAEYNVKSCTEKYDDCHHTYDFRHSGQNMAIKTSKDPIPLDEVPLFLYDGIDDWFDEHGHCPHDKENTYTTKTRKCRHFTVMVDDRNIYVGCAAILMNKKKIVFTCNYAWVNWLGKSMYTSGITAMDCQTGPHAEYEGLCTVKERYILH